MDCPKCETHGAADSHIPDGANCRASQAADAKRHAALNRVSVAGWTNGSQSIPGTTDGPDCAYVWNTGGHG